jgi:hypothetical protein
LWSGTQILNELAARVIGIMGPVTGSLLDMAVAGCAERNLSKYLQASGQLPCGIAV